MAAFRNPGSLSTASATRSGRRWIYRAAYMAPHECHTRETGAAGENRAAGECRGGVQADARIAASRFDRLPERRPAVVLGEAEVRVLQVCRADRVLCGEL